MAGKDTKVTIVAWDVDLEDLGLVVVGLQTTGHDKFGMKVIHISDHIRENNHLRCRPES